MKIIGDEKEEGVVMKVSGWGGIQDNSNGWKKKKEKKIKDLCRYETHRNKSVERKRMTKGKILLVGREERKVDHCNEKCRVVKPKFSGQNREYSSGCGNEK